MSEQTLFRPLKIGPIHLNHRIAMAPMTRLRADADRIPTGLMEEYYGQRANMPGTLLITEGTFISPRAAGGFPHAPGIWSREQISGWRRITDAVHSRGSYIYCQLFANGRAADVDQARSEGIDIVAPSAIPIPNANSRVIQDAEENIPRAMTTAEIKQTIADFAQAARNAVEAGFDGVEVHGANGYLLDQFIQDVSNTRDDDYGGNMANRTRLLSEVLDAVIDAVGGDAGRVGLRLSPWSPFQGMRMADPVPQFSHVVATAGARELAYLHLVEARISGAGDRVVGGNKMESLDFAIRLWKGPILVAGGYTPEDARRLVEEVYPNKDIVVVFGRHFLANPDLVYKIKEGLELNNYDRETFYSFGSPVGYVDYPFCEDFLKTGDV